jgi:hypothetical protein
MEHAKDTLTYCIKGDILSGEVLDFSLVDQESLTHLPLRVGWGSSEEVGAIH